MGPGSRSTAGVGRGRVTSPVRLGAALAVSLACHLLIAGAVVAQRSHRSPVPVASTIVLVDLPPARDPVSDGPVVLPAETGQDDVAAAPELARRVETLTEQNAQLTAGLADQQRRTAQLEAEYRQQIDSLKSAVGHLGDEAAALAADNAALATQVEAGRARATALQEELVRREEAEEAVRKEMQEAHDRLVAALRREIADKDVALDAANRRITVSIVDRVLFPSGQATLTAEGEPIVDRIGAVLALLPDPHVVVVGHTDNVPIGPALQSRFATNWELSTARATEVVRRMIERSAIAPDRLRATGRADTEPVASNDTEDGRRRNRRIEIILLPPALSDVAS